MGSDEQRASDLLKKVLLWCVPMLIRITQKRLRNHLEVNQLRILMSKQKQILLLFTVDHFAVGLDVTDSASVQNVLDEVINKYQRAPNTIINCAGITRDGFILKMNENDFDMVLKVNLKVDDIFESK